MDRNYNVEDILAEIKRKKEVRQVGGDFAPVPRPAVPPRQAAPPSYSEELDSHQAFPFDAVSAQASNAQDEPLEAAFAPSDTPLQDRLFGSEAARGDSNPFPSSFQGHQDTFSARPLAEDRPMQSRFSQEEFSQERPVQNHFPQEEFPPERPVQSRFPQEEFSQERPVQSRFPQEDFAQERPVQSRFSQEEFAQERPVQSRFPQEEFSQERPVQSRFPQEDFPPERPVQSRFPQEEFPQERPVQNRFPQEEFPQERPVQNRFPQEDFPPERPVQSRFPQEEFSQERPVQSRFSQEDFAQERPVQSRFPQEEFPQERPVQNRFPQEEFPQERPVQSRFPQEEFPQERPVQSRFSQEEFPQERPVQSRFSQEEFAQERPFSPHFQQERPFGENFSQDRGFSTPGFSGENSQPSFVGKFSRPPQQQTVPPPNPFAEERFSTPEAMPPVQEQPPVQSKPRTSWGMYANLDASLDNGFDNRTQVNLPRLGENPIKAADDVLGFGETTQELPHRIGRRLGRNGVQMDFGMEEQEQARETAMTKSTKPDRKKEVDLEPINDYNSPEDKAAIIADFIKVKKGLVIRLSICMLLLIFSLYLSFAGGIQAIPLPEFMWPETNMRLFLTIHTVIGVLAMLACYNIVGAGLISLFKMRSDSDTLPALAGIAAVIQGIVSLSRPEAYKEYGSTLLFAVTILCFIFNLLGKIMLSNRIVRNFKLVSSDCVKYSMGTVDNKELMRELTKGISLDSYEIAYPQPTVHLAAFLDHSYCEDTTDTVYRFLAPICLAGALIMALVSFFTGEHNLLLAAHAFAAILAICASFTSNLIVNLPLDRLSHLLTQEGGMVSGYSAVEDCTHLDGVALFDYDLIRPDQVVLHGIKTFDESRIDEVIIDAASVVLSREGTLTSLFNQLIGGNTKMLRPVSDMVYEDSMGISATVNGKQILIGSRELLRRYGIAPPPQDLEDRFANDGREVLYLSDAGQLCAMFVISYRVNEETLHLTERLAKQDMYLFIHTCNPNLTAQKISELFGYPEELVHIFPAKAHATYEEQAKLQEKAPAAVGFMGKNLTMVKSIIGAISVRGSISVGLLLQLISVVLGYGLITFLAIQGALPSLSFTHILLYQGIWTALILLIPNLKKLI